MISDSLSNIELYFSQTIINGLIIIDEDEFNHVIKVMRHKAGDRIYITDGKGKIYYSEIILVNKKDLSCDIIEEKSFDNKFSNITFCIPRLKNSGRFEFALEKLVELGITNIIIYDADRSIAKGQKIHRWNKILISAMKQSLSSHLPKLKFLNSIKDILTLTGVKILFEQNSSNELKDFSTILNNNYYFIFGPEGGINKKELNLFEDNFHFKITDKRMRSETAIICAASILNIL